MMAMTHSWFEAWLKQAQSPFVLYGGGAVFATVCYLIWRISRRIVWMGYFLLFAAIGFGLASAISYATLGQLAPLPFLYSAGLGFAAFVSAVRSRILKIVGALGVLVACQTMGSLWVKELKPPAQNTHRTAQSSTSQK